MSLAAVHAKLVQSMMRVFALGLAVCGVALVLSATHVADSVLFDREDTVPRRESIATAIVGAVCVVAGVTMMRRRAYRPDLGDVSWWAGKAGGYDSRTARGTEPRSWWTGEPEPRRDPQRRIRTRDV
jgi:hypothetical protein